VDRPESFPRLVGVLDTDDSFALGMATAALNEAGIVYDVVAIADLPAKPEAEKAKWWIRPSRILVATEDASEARSLLEPFRQPKSLSEIRADSAQELVDDPKPGRTDAVLPISRYIWRGPPDAPVVQRVGAWLIGSAFVCFGLFF
jgi:hypothetical protein